MSYIGSTPTSQNFISGTDYFNGTGSQTAFTLTRTVNSVNDIEAVVNNVVQQPNSAYTISGNTITFTSAPSAGTSNIYVRYLSTTMQSFTVPANSITLNQLDSNLQSVAVGRNRIINGAMAVNQRAFSGSITDTGAVTYTLDRWNAYGSVTAKFSVAQSSTAPTGFNNSLLVTSSSAYTVGASEFFLINQAIEGFNTADLGWGTASAKTVTLSFQVYSSLTGTFGGSITNSGNSRSYPFTYTVSSVNTWTSISVTIAGDTSGTWLTTNGIGLYVRFGLGVGSTFSGTAGSWSSNAYYSATGATSVVGTNGATFYITGVQLEKGTQATSFEYRQYGTELALCQRYYWQTGAVTSNLPAWTWVSTQFGTTLWFPVPMRSAPSGTATTSTNAYTFYMAGSLTQFNSITFGILDTRSSDIVATTSGATAGQGGFFAVGGGGNIKFSSEL